MADVVLNLNVSQSERAEAAVGDVKAWLEGRLERVVHEYELDQARGKVADPPPFFTRR